MGAFQKCIVILCVSTLSNTPGFAGGTFSGLGLPEYGGGFAGISRPGVFGVGYNPAAAISEETNLLIDTGLIFSNYNATLTGGEPLIYNSMEPVPFFALTTPINDRLGLGFNLGAPYARSGGTSTNESQRFHSMEGGITIIQLDSSLAYLVNENLTIGAGASIANVQASSMVAIDTGAILYSLFGGDEIESLIGEPIMEGTRTLENGKATGIGANIGFRYRSDTGVEATGSYRSQITSTLDGTVLLRPSNTFNLYLTGDLTGEVVIPMELQASVSVPVGALNFTAEANWVNWSATSQTSATIANIVPSSENHEFLTLLESYGLTDPELYGSTQSVGVNGFSDTFAFGGRVRWSHSVVEVVAGAMFAPNATPDEWAHPGNIDFQSIDYYAGLLHSISNALTLGYSAAYIDVQDREITTSMASFTAPASSAPIVPSGNGNYSLDLLRIGLSIIYKL